MADDVVGADGDVEQSRAQGAARERTGAGEEVVVDRLPTVVVTAECTSAGKVPDRVGGEARFHRGVVPGRKRGVEPPDRRDIVLADTHPGERKSPANSAASAALAGFADRLGALGLRRAV